MKSWKQKMLNLNIDYGKKVDKLKRTTRNEKGINEMKTRNKKNI